jgi:tryptophan-rich sensory protein
MGAARWLVTRSARVGSAQNPQYIGVLIATCLAYPFYTHLIRGHVTELVGNLVSLTLATGVAVRIWSDSRVGAVLIGLVAAWIVFATVLVFALVRLNGWPTT